MIAIFLIKLATNIIIIREVKKTNFKYVSYTFLCLKLSFNLFFLFEFDTYIQYKTVTIFIYFMADFTTIKATKPVVFNDILPDEHDLLDRYPFPHEFEYVSITNASIWIIFLSSRRNSLLTIKYQTIGNA